MSEDVTLFVGGEYPAKVFPPDDYSMSDESLPSDKDRFGRGSVSTLVFSLWRWSHCDCLNLKKLAGGYEFDLMLRRGLRGRLTAGLRVDVLWFCVPRLTHTDEAWSSVVIADKGARVSSGEKASIEKEVKLRNASG